MENDRQRRSVATEPARYEQMKELLLRYPATADWENAELATYLRTGPMLDRALLTGIPEVQGKMEQFAADHKAEFAFKVRDYVVIVLILVATVVAGYGLWDSGL